MIHPSLELPIAILCAARNIAVVGLSRDSSKEAHQIPMDLSRAGYEVVGVNPFAVPDVDGVQVVVGISEVPFQIDIVNVFRPSSDTDAIIDEAIQRHQLQGDVACVWLQLGITSEYGAERCSAAGIAYIEDTCIKVIQRYLSN